jgi:hypothetical protein
VADIARWLGFANSGLAPQLWGQSLATVGGGRLAMQFTSVNHDRRLTFSAQRRSHLLRRAV